MLRAQQLRPGVYSAALRRSLFSAPRHARRPHLKKTAGFITLLLAVGLLSVSSPANATNAVPVDLLSAKTYSVLGGTGITNTGVTTLSRDLGLSTSGNITGFPPGIVSGTTNNMNAAAAQAQDDRLTAYSNAAAQTADDTFSGDQKGKKYTAGVYSTGTAFALSGAMDLNAQNNPNAVFIFNVNADLNTTTAAANVSLINGAQPGNVFWRVAGAATISAGATFSGTILAAGAVTIGSGAFLNGRALSAGLVTLDTNSIITTFPMTVPGAPTDVSAPKGNGQASVSWTPPASNGGSAITEYTVTASGGQIAHTTGATKVTVIGLTNGTAYTFTVTATNAIGTSPASAASTAVIPSTVPVAPTGVSATAGNGQASVSWTPPTNGGSAITMYTVTASGGQVATTTGATTATVTGLPNGIGCTFTVTATNVSGTSPDSVAAIPIIPSTVPEAPRSVSATAGNGQASVSWTPPASNGGSAITMYTVTSSGGQRVATTGATMATMAAVAGLTNGTAYTFTVTATNAAGTSPASAATTLGPALTPTFLPSPPPVGGATVLLGGRTITSAVTANRRKGTITVSGGNLQITVSPQSPEGANLALDSDGIAILNAGGNVVWNGRGAVPGSPVNFYLLRGSTATFLGGVDVFSAGTYARVPIPGDLARGTYTLQVKGLTKHTRQAAVVTRASSFSISILVRVIDPAPAAEQTVVYFDVFSAKLTKRAKRALNTLVARLPTRSSRLVRIVGFAGPGYSIGVVKALSKARAKSVARHLRSKGVRGKYILSGRRYTSENGTAAQRASVLIIPNKGT